MGIWDKVYGILDSELDARLSQANAAGNLAKSSSVFEPLEKKMKEDGYGRKGLIFDPFTDQGYAGGLFKPKGAGSGLISNLILKIVSRRDPVVSTILHVYGNNASKFCRRQLNRFETGFKVQPKDKNSQEINQDEIDEIEEFILNTGSKDERSEEDKMTFEQWAYMVTRDMLSYGHSAIELVRDMTGNLHAFLPLPAESIFYANKKLVDKDVLENAINTYKESYKKVNGEKDDYDVSAPSENYEYLQVINGKVVEGFTRNELIFARIYLQGDIDLNGYSIGPLERAISMITSHLQIENHQKMFFTHGVASRGLLVIQGDVTPNQLRTLQAQWTNQVTGGNNAWRTPILAGIQGVQWQPLTETNRDMEYAAYQDHVLRTIHACFAIDPEETGFGYLSKGVEQRSLGESSNEWKITASRDRGLRPLLSRLEAIINEQILPEWNKDYAEKYDFCFVGLDAETREEEINRLKEEVQLHTTLDEVRQEADLQPMKIGGGLILNPLLVQTLQANMTKGMFMEKFMNIEGAGERPDLQYVPDQYWFQWQQMQMQIMQQQATHEATMNQEAPEEPGKQPEDPQARREQQAQDQHEEAMGDHEQEQANAQAQSMAIDQFIQANPALFKSMLDNLKKSEYSDKHVDEMRDELVKDFEKASSFLIKEVMDAVKSDLEERDEVEKVEPPKEEKPKRKKPAPKG